MVLEALLAKLCRALLCREYVPLDLLQATLAGSEQGILAHHTLLSLFTARVDDVLDGLVKVLGELVELGLARREPLFALQVCAVGQDRPDLSSMLGFKESQHLSSHLACIEQLEALYGPVENVVESLSSVGTEEVLDGIPPRPSSGALVDS